MNPDDYRDLQLLREIASRSSVTQRSLAKRYGLALGLTNFLIRRLITKGYVKIVNLERKRLRYLITPRGLAEKARLSYDYLEYSLYFYREIRAFLTRALSVIAQTPGARIVLYGTSEVAEVACLILQEEGVDLVAVIEDEPDSRRTLVNNPVRPLEALRDLACDWVVVASLRDVDGAVQRLSEIGVPREKILAIASPAGEPSAPAAPEPAPLAMVSGLEEMR